MTKGFYHVSSILIILCFNLHASLSPCYIIFQIHRTESMSQRDSLKWQHYYRSSEWGKKCNFKYTEISDTVVIVIPYR